MKIICAFSLIILLMMSGIAPILINSLPNKIWTTSVENVSPLLVMFGDSEAEIAARDQLLQNFPNSIVNDFSASKSQIIEHIGPVIYIGHSSEEGISYGNQLVQWNLISEIISKSVSNNHYILGCNSQTISELTAQTGKNVVSFDFEIDALIGVGIITLNILQNLENEFWLKVLLYQQIIKRFVEIKSDPQRALYLPGLDPGDGGSEPGDEDDEPSSYFSNEELYLNTVFIVLALFGLVFSAFSLYANRIADGTESTLIAVAEGADGINSVIQAVVTLVTTGQYTFDVFSDLTVGAVPLIYALIGTLSFWNQVAALASFGVDLIAYFSPATIWNIISLLIASVTFGLTVAIAVCDYNDPDGDFGNC